VCLCCRCEHADESESYADWSASPDAEREAVPRQLLHPHLYPQPCLCVDHALVGFVWVESTRRKSRIEMRPTKESCDSRACAAQEPHDCCSCSCSFPCPSSCPSSCPCSCCFPCSCCSCCSCCCPRCCCCCCCDCSSLWSSACQEAVALLWTQPQQKNPPSPAASASLARSVCAREESGCVLRTQRTQRMRTIQRTRSERSDDEEDPVSGGPHLD